MISITESDSKALNLLIRNPKEHFSIRQIALKIGITPAGAHRLLKNLEKANILKSQKFGSGVFYTIDLYNHIARNLAAFILSQSYESYPKEFDELRDYSSALLQKANKYFLIVEQEDKNEAEVIAGKLSENISVITRNEFIEGIKRADKEILELINTSSVIFGENKIVEMIKDA
ncbi:winged helix-turn-helix domain-containing protein [Nanoarchaeota archaeon]